MGDKKIEKEEEVPSTESLPIFRSPQFMKYYATNFRCGVTEVDFRIELCNEKLEVDKGWELITDAMVIMTPECAKRMNDFLTQAIDLYEKKNGEIRVKEHKETY
ncbi:MAG: DUF3467 domain-containing protein [Candidatus Thermoplasmatota archaeon]|nr:DUF3467 domain-containing protein [Candidatus Thermoplasmatota archaeon]